MKTERTGIRNANCAHKNALLDSSCSGSCECVTVASDLTVQNEASATTRNYCTELKESSLKQNVTDGLDNPMITQFSTFLG